ncbi:M43 family zinc metalloprotease [uncultured Lacinutrix sp.]|uniref:zinc-dependent metalloprotease n=1 Tax=uncultured Lacinutrix sp. TaxID=574032 RepID=UPI002613C61D|nr:M43 family zinc metalloprotease [uncultured Lacinutrix sp.]
MRLKLSLLLLLFSITTIINAQERTCGMVEYMQEKMKDPEYVKQYQKTQAKFKAQLEKNLANKSSSRMMDPIIIPVAVHFPSGVESDRACLEALAQNQIDILNADFNGTNADISNWTAAQPYYPGVSTGNANFLFCIATMNHPTGIDPDMVEGGPAVTIGYNFGSGSETDPAWGGYMNFLVKDIGAGLLGFSPFPGNVAAGQSVTMNLGAFGSGAGCPNSGIVPGAPYDLGRTVTHELGHFYNLDHTFTGSCSSDDGIADTPNQNASSGGCPALGSQAGCVSGEQVLFQSYMDYTNDACMFMFSSGQTDVARALVMSLESTFKPNVVSCSAAPDFNLTAANTSQNICTPTNEVTYSINYVATGGNTDTTTFSATNLPAGATASFNPATLNADGTTTLTVSNLSGVATGNYAITITGTGVTTNTINVDLGVEGAAPSIPTLTSPSNGATGTSIVVNLDWSPIASATSYTVETATDSGFTTNTTSDTVNSVGFNTPTLQEMTQYFWRVKSINGCGESTYSSVYDFTTASISCSTYNSTQNNINIPGTGNSAHVITSTINITDDTTITDLNTTINIQHIWAGDMELMLTSPAGTSVIMLPNSLCDDGTDDIAVTYDDQAAGPVSCSTTAPCVGGTAQPSNPLSAFNGENTIGDWVLTATDGYPSADGGEFLNFSIEICGVTSALSVDEFSISNSIKLWPNPSNGDINISFNTQNNDNVNVSLYDLRGRIINKQSFNNTPGIFNKTIQFGDLESSVYILSVENGGQIINKRVIIE